MQLSRNRRDADEFEAFVVASQASLRRTAYLMCGDWSMASDHVQEALIKVYRHWPRLQHLAAVQAYARRTVVNTVIDAQRRRSSTELPVAEVLDIGGRAVRDHSGPTADRDLLNQCLAQLPARQRACVVLRYYEDLPVAEVADILGIGQGTVKSSTSRGIAALQTIWADASGDVLSLSGRSE